MKRTIAGKLAAALLGGLLVLTAQAATAPAAATPAAAPATPAPAASTAAKPAAAPVHHKKKSVTKKPAAAPAASTKPAATAAAPAPAPAAPVAAAPLPAPTNTTPVAGTATLVTGHVSAATPSGEIRDLEKGGPVYPGETITTASASYVNIEFSDGGRVLLRPETRFAIERYQYAGGGAQAPATQQASAQPAQQESAFFRLLKGGFRAVSGLIGHTRREDYAVQTPVATIGIRGTDYEVRLCAGDCADITPTPKDGLYGGVQSGAIALDNSGGTTTTTAGQYVFIAGLSTVGQSLATRPAALGQPLPDPKTCN